MAERPCTTLIVDDRRYTPLRRPCVNAAVGVNPNTMQLACADHGALAVTPGVESCLRLLAECRTELDREPADRHWRYAEAVGRLSSIIAFMYQDIVSLEQQLDEADTRSTDTFGMAIPHG